MPMPCPDALRLNAGDLPLLAEEPRPLDHKLKRDEVALDVAYSGRPLEERLLRPAQSQAEKEGAAVLAGDSESEEAAAMEDDEEEDPGWCWKGVWVQTALCFRVTRWSGIACQSLCLNRTNGHVGPAGRVTDHLCLLLCADFELEAEAARPSQSGSAGKRKRGEGSPSDEVGPWYRGIV